MKYWYQTPQGSLRDYVRTVLILEGFSQANSVKVPLVTSGMPVFICKTQKQQTGAERMLQLTLFGRTAPDDCWKIDETMTVVAYFFKPFVMACFFNLSAASLNSDPVELNHWNAHMANALRTQLGYASSTKEKVEILDNLLECQLQRYQKECELITKATDEMLFNTETTALGDLLKNLGISQRTFQRIFKKYVGVSPTQYRRICQFQLSFVQLRAKEFTKLTDIAFDNGFADQSHFIRSFKEFTDITPKDYLRMGLKKN